MKVLVPFGTRPEAIKLAPIVRALEARGVEVRTLATGQHFEPSMAASIWAELGLAPDATWELPSAPSERSGALFARALEELESRPDLVLVLGDTQTVPAFCLAARTHRVPVAHVEAGIRSFNETSIEEVNRRVAATTASLHFAPTVLAADLLVAEGVAAERVRVVGNPVVDAVVAAGVERVPPAERDGILFTAHRATNVDDPGRLERVVALLLALVAEAGPVTFPVHPRTRARLAGAGALARLREAGVELVEPLPYRELLELLASSRVVVTDSGGLQEEASWLGVPSVVLRRSTPRWETVLAGASRLVALDVERALEAVRELGSDEEQERIASLPCPFGDGDTAERIAAELLDPATAPLLRIEEADYVGRTPPGGIEAVLFDLDDTLYPQQAWLEGAWHAVADEAVSWGIDREAFFEALCRTAAEGSARGGIIDRALVAVGAGDAPIPPLVTAFRAYRPATLPLYPGVREALEDLRQRVPIGLVTDGDPQLQRSKLQALGLQDAFDVVVLSDELGPLARKPSPEPFRLALATLGVEARHAAHVGDNPIKDVTGALAAGMQAIRVQSGEYAAAPDGLPPWRRVRNAVEAIELLRPHAVGRRPRTNGGTRMSSSSGIEWALDKVAELAGSYNEDDPALGVLLALVAALDPPPQAARLEPAARRIGKLRLAQVLDHPGDLRIGAVRLLAALESAGPSSPQAQVGWSPEPPAAPESAAPEPLAVPVEEPVAAPVEEPVAPPAPLATRPPAARPSAERIVLTFPRPAEETDVPPASGGLARSRTVAEEPELSSTLQRSAAKAQGAFRKAIIAARRGGETRRPPAGGEIYRGTTEPASNGNAEREPEPQEDQ